MERRLTAILAADVAGYSLLMNADEDRTYAAWRSARTEVIDPAIDASRGRIVKHTGDGFLAEFPTVLAAVGCGVAIQEEMARRNAHLPDEQRFQFRIGINLGDIIVDQEDIHGDGVNIAARLESIAAAGGICISGDVYNQVHSKLDLRFEDLGERRVKNIGTPVRAYGIPIGNGHGHPPAPATAQDSEARHSQAPGGEVHSPVAGEDGIAFEDMLDGLVRRGPRPAAFVVGRDAEKALLRQAFADAEARCGNVVLIRGEPGIGKTSLVYAFAEEVGDKEALVVHGHCHETLDSPPFWPWLEILKGLQTVTDSEEASDTTFFEGAADARSPWRVGLASMFSNPGGADQFMLFTKVARHLCGLASKRPLVIVIDDIHWADKSSLLLLTHLCRRLSGQAILVIGTYRDHEITRKHPLFEALGDIAREADVHRIALEGLSEDETSEVIERTMSFALPANLLRALYEKTQGNPLFVSEVARILQQEMGASKTGSLVIEIPEGIQEAIGRRLNQLSPPCNELLSAASVIGRRFGLRALASVQEASDPLEVLQILEEAMRSGIVEEHGGGFRFCHVLVRDMLYDELSLVKKITRHRKVADTLVQLREQGFDHPIGEIARHYYHAIQGGRADKAVEYAIRAAEDAAKSFAHDEAVSFYQLALEASSVDEGRREDRKAEIYLDMLVCMQHFGASNTRILETLHRCRDEARACKRYDILAEAASSALRIGGGFTGASELVAILEEALSYLKEDDLLLRARVLARLGAALMFSHRRGEAEQCVRAATAAAFQSGDKPLQCYCLWVGIVALRTRPEKLSERIQLGEQCLRLALDAADGQYIDEALEWLILSHQESGNIERVRQLVSELASVAERYHFHSARYFVAWTNAYLALLEGRWDEAERLAEEAAEVGAGSHDGGSEGVYGAQMFLLNRERARLPMIRGALEQLTAQSGTRLWKPGLLATYTELGLLDEAKSVFDELVAGNYSAVLQDDLYSICLVYLTEACVALGDVDKARSLYQRLAPFSGQMLSHPTAACYGPADLYLGMLASEMNDLPEAERLLASAAALCEGAGPNIWSAHVRYHHARVLKRHNFAGGRALFVEKVDEARSLAKSMDMVNLLAKIDALDADSPAHDRDETTTLTRRELEVLDLITRGRSNKQIAAELNRSLATVATHVRSILIKTNTANRTAAAAYARDSGLFEDSTSEQQAGGR